MLKEEIINEELAAQLKQAENKKRKAVEKKERKAKKKKEYVYFLCFNCITLANFSNIFKI